MSYKFLNVPYPHGVRSTCPLFVLYLLPIAIYWIWTLLRMV